MRRIVAVPASVLLLLGNLGCGNDGGRVRGPDAALPPDAEPQVSVRVSPDPVIAGYPATVTVTVLSVHAVVRSVSVDFTNDGTLDDVQSFDRGSVTATFTHAYDAVGTFTARVEVAYAQGTPTVATRSIAVSEIVDVPVWVEVAASSRGVESECYAEGPPATCDGCRTMLLRSRTPLGSMAKGAPVSVVQQFSQGGLTAACDFSLTLLAGPAGGEVTFARSGCRTTIQPSDRACSSTVSGAVP